MEWNPYTLICTYKRSVWKNDKNGGEIYGTWNYSSDIRIEVEYTIGALLELEIISIAIDRNGRNMNENVGKKRNTQVLNAFPIVVY